MKKLLSMVLVVFALVVGTAVIPETMPQASAQSYWNGDTNYPGLHERYGFDSCVWYLDRSSVVVKRNTETNGNIERIWAENVISVSKDNAQTTTYWFRDDNGTFYYRVDNTQWSKFDPYSSFRDWETIANACQYGWRIAFGEGFPAE